MEKDVPIKRYLWILLLFGIANLLEVTLSQTNRPLCYTQISAANQACTVLSPETMYHSLMVANNGTKHDNVRDDDDDGGGGDDDSSGDDGGSGDDDGGGDDDDHGGDDDHGDDDDHVDDDDHDDDDHHHRRRKHKRKKRGHHESSANKECCRWLNEVDNGCVCEMLLKLPPFLIKPKHKFMVRVGHTCRFTYSCPGFLPLPRRHRH